jgi:type IX secretion system PorP/SprF family membrane protein
MIKRLLTSAIVTLGLLSVLHAQTPGHRPYRQFFANPYLFNPAYVGINNQAELNLSYRQQWMGFKDSPVITGLNLQLPTNNRVAIGFNIASDKQVLLRNNSFMATFGYILPIAENQSLRFGLSGGVGMNSIDLNSEELNTNDPAIVNAANNNFYVDGNVGVVYTHSGLKLGFAFTELFSSNSFNHDSFSKFAFSNLRNRLYSVSYRFNVGIMENFAVEPYVLYRESADGLQNAWEAASVVYYKDKIWTGAGYNQNNGLSLFLGMNLKDKFRVSYSYEFPPFKSGVTSTSAHELHLTYKFGKKKAPVLAKNKPKPTIYQRPANEVAEADAQEEEDVKTDDEEVVIAKNAPAPKVDTTPAQNAASENTTKEVPAENLAKTNPEAVKVNKYDLAKTEEAAPVGRPAKSFTIAKGHYVVVAVFSMMDHSTKFTKQLVKEGYEVNVALNPKNKFYYVYIFSTYDVEEAKKVRNQYRWKNLFKEAWVFTME